MQLMQFGIRELQPRRSKSFTDCILPNLFENEPDTIVPTTRLNTFTAAEWEWARRVRLKNDDHVPATVFNLTRNL